MCMCPPTTRSSSSTSAASLRSTCKPLNPCFPSTAYVLVASVAKGDQDFDRWVGVPQTKCFPPHTLNFLRVRSIYRKVNLSPTSAKVRLGISPAVMLGVRSVMYPISPIWWPSISTTYSAVSNCDFHGITFEPENSILSSAASSSTRLVASKS